MIQRRETRTGGREATTRHIFGQFALSVGMPTAVPPPGWQWIALGDVARLESGHTPSRRRPEYWGGDIPWIGIRDAKVHHGKTIQTTAHSATRLGIQNSSSRILPEGTVCLSRTASVGYVVTMGRPMATSQDFANWICSDKLDRRFLAYLFLAEQESLFRFASGAIHQTIYYPELKAFHICAPSLPEQQRIVSILNEVFEGLANATANAEKNLKNARELFESYLISVFDQAKPIKTLSGSTASRLEDAQHDAALPHSTAAGSTKTGGRAATTRRIEGSRSLSVGMPLLESRKGWNWCPLNKLARMESGHTPSRRHPEYWDGEIPWIGIKDAKANHGSEIKDTFAHTNDLGIRNSSARLLPAKTVCLSRTASVGYVTVMGRPMATSQDFVNWVCFQNLNPHFLMYLFLAQGAEISRFSSGAVHQTIYFPEAKAFHICVPPRVEQDEVVRVLDAFRKRSEALQKHYQDRLVQLSQLRLAILRKAFAGEIAPPPSNEIPEAEVAA